MAVMMNDTQGLVLNQSSDLTTSAWPSVLSTERTAGGGGEGVGGGVWGPGEACVPGQEYVPISIPPDLFRHTKSWLPLKTITTADVALKITFYVVVMAVDVCGNGLVMLLVALNRKMRTATNVLLVNLALADLLLALLCMWVHLGSSVHQDWPFGLTVCKVNMFAQVMVITSSVLTLTTISVERFFAIVFPLRRNWTLRLTVVLIALIWLIACSIASPQLHVRELEEYVFSDRHVISCMEEWTQVYLNEQCDTWQPYKVLYHMMVGVVMFLVPILIMGVSYTVICVCLLCRKAPGSSSSGNAKKRVVRMLVMVVVVFVICWTPTHVLEVIPLFDTDYRASEAGNYAALFIGYTNSALNPIMYAGFNENFRRGFQEIFRCQFLRFVAQTSRVTPHDPPPTCSRAPSQVVTTAAAHQRHEAPHDGPGMHDKHHLHVHTVTTSLATTSFNGAHSGSHP